jgi:hypothetical protein
MTLGGGSQLAAAVVAATLLQLTGSAWAERFTFADREIALAPPQGQCVLDPQRQNEQRIISQEKTVLGMRGAVAMVFADCKDIDDLRSGRTQKLSGVSWYIVDGQVGKRLTPADMSRQQFVAQTVEALNAQGLNQINSLANPKIAKTGQDASPRANPISILAQDDTAIYIGGSLKIAQSGDNAVSRDAVYAMTVVNGLRIGIEAVQLSIDNNSLKRLLERQHTNIGALLQLNASNDSTATIAKHGIDWVTIWVIALCAGPIGLILLFMLRKNRQQGSMARCG